MLSDYKQCSNVKVKTGVLVTINSTFEKSSIPATMDKIPNISFDLGKQKISLNHIHRMTFQQSENSLHKLVDATLLTRINKVRCQKKRSHLTKDDNIINRISIPYKSIIRLGNCKKRK